ncbi:hypothetical protein BJV74DRAFT_823651 [Russula compacta]|nr:hypothetical protein BJV74DRAFT_823651 [Russula compacta]
MLQLLSTQNRSISRSSSFTMAKYRKVLNYLCTRQAFHHHLHHQSIQPRIRPFQP